MSGPLPYPDSAAEPDGGSPPRMPRWVKVSAVAVVVVVVLVIGLMVFTGQEGQHGPGQHVPGGEPARQTEREGSEGRAPADEGHRPPPGIPDH